MDGKLMPRLVYVLLFSILCVSLVMAWAKYKKYEEASMEVNSLKEELEKNRSEYMALKKEIHDLEHEAYAAEKVAREKFRMCREGEQVYIYTE